jgi:hypothetical protein
MRRSFVYFFVGLIFSLGLVPLAIPAVEKQSGAFSRVVTAEVQGLVLYADGETPAAQVPVRIWDINQREFLFETITDENGYFTLPKLEPGKYYVTFDWMKLELLVVDSGEVMVQQPHDIIVVIPRGLGFMNIYQLGFMLTASTLSDMAIMYQREWSRTKVVSP